MLKLARYSLGIGDRFGHQGKAQLSALQQAAKTGLTIIPVWNKSHREHTIIGTKPQDVRTEADKAVAESGWKHDYHVDADHIGLGNVDLFLASSDFFTLDVADFTGKAADSADIDAFVKRHENLIGTIPIPGLEQAVRISRNDLVHIAASYLLAVQEAARIYRHIAGCKGPGTFITEVSMDETNMPQTPLEMLVILAAIADEGIPAQTIAPKFSGRFNKGVDYVGDPARFATEFQADLAIIDFAIQHFGLPENLKLSVHSGSDKFSIYQAMGEAIRDFDTGLHLKTAGTTWLEELVGLASAGGEGLTICTTIYRQAWERFDELCAPYATVIDIDRAALPEPATVADWDGDTFAAAVRHEPNCPAFNANVRQLLHVGYKVAAEMGDRFTQALDACEDTIAENVAMNLFERHIQRLFG